MKNLGEVLLTGGAGFVGSHIVDRLIADGCSVTVYDTLKSTGDFFIKQHKDNPNFQLVEADILDLDSLKKALAGKDFVFHLAANADVRGGITNTKVDLEQNTIGTYNVLEAMRANDVKGLSFASSSAIYGDAEVFPTPETYAPTQTSLYGASKLAGEAMVEAFSEYYGIRSTITRYVSMIGERYTHGVIFDFTKKLLANPKELEIFGDGSQEKPYLYIGDSVAGTLCAIEKSKEQVNVINIGNDECINVDKIRDIIVDELGLSKIEYKYKGGKRGWKGDAPKILLDTTKIKKLGWAPTISIEEGIRRTVRYLLENKQLLNRD
ncbi:MAG: NAD-dependent epimerase/dehydratase family protein [archaeon]